jgi:hypothetical protein
MPQKPKKERLKLKRTGLRVVRKKSDITHNILHMGSGWGEL